MWVSGYFVVFFFLSWYFKKTVFLSIGFPAIPKLYQIEVFSRKCHNLLKFRVALTSPDFQGGMEY